MSGTRSTSAVTAATGLSVRYPNPPSPISPLTFNQLIHRKMSTAAKAPFILYTEATPNGKKISAHLEELKSTYGDKVKYEFV